MVLDLFRVAVNFLVSRVPKMIGSFPYLYPEELVYSACARYSERVAYPTRRAVVVELFSAENVKAVVDLPCHLGSLVARLQAGHNYTVDYLIDNHTLLPYYSRFIPQVRLDALRSDMASGSGQRIHTRAGIKASRISYPAKLRFCAACAAYDRRQFGETYWHRVHQVPGVLVCPTHTEFLQDSSVFTQPHSRFDFISAESTVPVVRTQSRDGVWSCDQHSDKLARIAIDTAWLLAHSNSTTTAAHIQALYIEELVRQGFALQTGRVRSSELSQAFLHHYSTELLVMVGCPPIDETGGRNWLSPLLRADARDIMQHPLYHLLLVQFLGYSAEEFFNSSSSVNSALPTDANDVIVPPPRSGNGGERRASWLELMKAHPDAGVSTLRRYNTSLYMWLYRNDGVWLTSFRPPSLRGRNRPEQRPTIVDWRKRDEALAGAVQDAANRIKASPGRPIRITVASISRKVGVGYTPLLRDHLDKLPNTALALQDVLESVYEHIIRCVRWALEQYIDEGVIPTQADIVARAGIYKVMSHPNVKMKVVEEIDRLITYKATV